MESYRSELDWNLLKMRESGKRTERADAHKRAKELIAILVRQAYRDGTSGCAAPVEAAS